MRKYILQTFCCNSTLQNAATVWGVLASVFSSILLITALATDIFMKRYVVINGNYYNEYYGRTEFFWIVVFVSTVHIIASIFLAIGAEKKNEYMLMPWIVVQATTFIVFIPVIIGILLCAAIVSFPVYIWWTVFSLFVSLRMENEQEPETRSTAPTSTALYENTFIDVQLPDYKDVVPGNSTKRN